MITDRLGMEVFAFNLHENIQDLVKRIENRVREEHITYCPLPDNKVYVPKASSTLRTMSMMCLPDLIVYQAMVNVIANTSHPHLVTHENQHVWGNLYAGSDSPWMLKRWKEQYNNFVKEIEKLYEMGNTWIASTDIVSFYDMIDHHILLDLVRKHCGEDDNFITLLRECLTTWASHSADTSMSRGIPQGSNASDYLANLYLYEIDQHMIAKGHHYVRYVDDIRILGKDKATVQQGLIDFDLELKKYGLVAQVSKTSVHEIENIEREITRLRFWVTDPIDSTTYQDEASLPSSEQASSIRDQIESSQSEHVEDQMDHEDIDDEESNAANKASVDENTSAESIQNQLLEEFHDAFEKLDDPEHGREANTKIVYCLNRLFKHDAIRDKVLDLLERLPWRSEPVTRYLALFKGDEEVIRALEKFVVEHEVYYWHRANALEALQEIAGAKRISHICRGWISDDLQKWYAKMVAVRILQKAPGQHAFFVEALREEQNRVGHDLSQKSLLRLQLAYSAFHTAKAKQKHLALLKLLLRPDESILMRRLVIYILQQPKCEVVWEDLTDHHQTLGEFADLIEQLGLAPDVPRPCYIRQSLMQLFDVEFTVDDLRPYLGNHYDEAAKALRASVRYFYSSNDDFVRNFHQFAHLTLVAFYQAILPSSGDPIAMDYANLCQTRDFKAQTPSGHSTWEQLGQLRNRVDHPIDRKTRLHSQKITGREAKLLKGQLGVALQELFDAWSSISPSVGKTTTP